MATAEADASSVVIWWHMVVSVRVSVRDRVRCRVSVIVCTGVSVSVSVSVRVRVRVTGLSMHWRIATPLGPNVC